MIHLNHLLRFPSPLLTKSKRLVAVIDIFAVDANQRELELVSELNGIVAVLKLLHISTHLLEWLLVNLVPVNDAWLDLIVELEREGREGGEGREGKGEGRKGKEGVRV